MDFTAPYIGSYIRVVSIICLLLGLNDTARLLGVQLGASSPITDLGMTGFVYLGIFALSRLFAAVGLWIKARWGAVLLVGATGVELALYLMGNADVQMSAFGFAVRLVLLASIGAILFLAVRNHRAKGHD